VAEKEKWHDGYRGGRRKVIRGRGSLGENVI